MTRYEREREKGWKKKKRTLSSRCFYCYYSSFSALHLCHVFFSFYFFYLCIRKGSPSIGKKPTSQHYTKRLQHTSYTQSARFFFFYCCYCSFFFVCAKVPLPFVSTTTTRKTPRFLYLFLVAFISHAHFGGSRNWQGGQRCA